MILRVLPLLSRPSRQGAAGLLLPGIAFASVTALLAIVIGGAQSFWGYDDDMAMLYGFLAGLALALMVPPLISLGSAAARLSARRRDDRLAVLRLLGATGRSTAGLAVFESAAVAFAGAVVGVLLAYALSPLIGLIHFRGAAIGTAQAALPLGWAALLILAVVAIAALSAMVGLRKVIISPLGVATKQTAPKMPWVQGLIAGAAILVAILAVSVLVQAGGDAGVAVVMVGFLIAFVVALLAIDLIGAWVLSLFGKARLRRAQTPVGLISARLVLESPRAAWRQVSGVAMSSFMAVFAGSGIALLGEASGAEAELTGPEQFLMGDMRTGLAIVVIGTFIMVACSVGVNQAAQILDRRDVHRSLAIMGTPLSVQDGARRKAATLPLAVASVGSAAIAAVLLFPILGAALIFAPLSLIAMLSMIVFGYLIVLGTLFGTRALLREASRVETVSG
ncbi:FtsX-like permease family protein [Leucobacter aridicollis]|uniref:FtsX-like permease family protein n=1 Tax=Leucobacter aridicollis TaxID=283878 RepID=UPI002166C503|nr:FtsX-like permease family protein [Leucobacter aridicollis]MCS3429344.1 putative lysophospholipase L1 biosynthesis ABC-type transport system permease subunit [Leucobacter aridicollis]